MLVRRVSASQRNTGSSFQGRAFFHRVYSSYLNPVLTSARGVITALTMINCAHTSSEHFRKLVHERRGNMCFYIHCASAKRYCSFGTTSELSGDCHNTAHELPVASEKGIHVAVDEPLNGKEIDSQSAPSAAAASPAVAGGPRAERPTISVRRHSSINSVTLVGVAHDIQTGYVYEDVVTQFTLTTTSLNTTNPTEECVVEKDHHTIRCFGDVFAQDVRARVKEGNVVCINGRLRLNPQIEPSCGKYYYFPYIQVQPPHGQVAVVYGDRRAPPSPVTSKKAEIPSEGDRLT